MDSVSVDVDSNGGFYTAFNNIFSDSSINSHSTSITKSGNQINVSSSGLFSDISNRDFNIIGTEAIDNGYDNSAIYSEDITGATRDANFDIGAFEN